MARALEQVLITLEKPWEGSSTGRFRVNIGFEDCIIVKDGYASSERPGERAVTKPGPRVFEELDAADPERCCALVDVGTAKLWFGDWDAVEGLTGDYEHDYVTITGPNGQLTIPRKDIAAEADRVACNFGDYRKKDGTGLKQDQIDLTPIGPPSCPHVRIERVDRKGVVLDGFCYRPWEFFHRSWVESFPEFTQKNKALKPRELAPKVVKVYA